MKKEITIAACSAVALVLIFGSASYLLFPQVTVQGYTASIDVFTQRGGKGTNRPSGNFSLGEKIYLFAEARNASNAPVAGVDVSFEVHWPANNRSYLIFGTNRTNMSGIAEYSFGTPSPPSPPNYIGNWLVYVSVKVDDQILVDTLTFFVR